MINVLAKLEKAGYKLSETKSEIFKTEIEWIGLRIDQAGIRPLQDKLLAIKELKQPNNEKELKSFLGPSNICQNTLTTFAPKQIA